MPERTLIVGADGVIGRSLAASLQSAGRDVVGTTRRPGEVGEGRVFLDLASIPDDWPVPRGVEAAVICAAITGREACERSPEHAREVKEHSSPQLVGKKHHKHHNKHDHHASPAAAPPDPAPAPDDHKPEP